MGRNTSGVKGIKLSAGDELVGMVVADPSATLLTVCANGYGKRTLFGPNESLELGATADEGGENEDEEDVVEEPSVAEEGSETEDAASGQRYRTQRRGGKGLRDIKTTDRNGPLIGSVAVADDDEVLVMTARGKLQRFLVKEISTIGRNTQGVRLMSLDEGDTVAAVVRVPKDENDDAEKA
jgi:DNA gyrase subunit A